MTSPRTPVSVPALHLPVRWVGGVCAVLAPLLLAAGMLVRLPAAFTPAAQLTAYGHHPVTMGVSHALTGAALLLLWPAAAVLAARVAERAPAWGLWGGLAVVSGLVARVFHAGADHMAFRSAEALGAAATARVVSETYGAFHVFSTLNAVIPAGWVILAFGALRARVLGPVRALALAATAALPLGVLKGTAPLSLVAVAGLAIALVPTGVELLRARPRPRSAAVLGWGAAALAALAALTVLGRLG